MEQRMQTTEQFECILSIDRLSGYHSQSKRFSSNPISLYKWNTALSESLYPALQTIEIALRNSIHNAVLEHFKDPYWLINDSILRYPEQLSVRKEEDSLRKKRVVPTFNILIAELKFGFWTSLLDERYEQILWPRIIKTAFPKIPSSIRTRRNLSRRFNIIRRLRNRVFHYEPIWHWADLKQQYSEVIEAIGWINPIGLELLSGIDRFGSVYDKGPINENT